MFEHDLFISYANLDNKSSHSLSNGWIEALHNRLNDRLGDLLGRQPNIWRDLKLRGNDEFSEEILRILSQSAIFVSIISPRYIKSEWCLKELQKFHKQAASSGVYVDNKSRIFKVIKTRIRHDEHPKELQGLLGYNFYMEDETTDYFWEFDQGDERYKRQLEKLAQDIKKMLEHLNNRQQIIGKSSGKTIYLAEPASDREEDYNSIKCDLQIHGYHVLPDRRLSRDKRIRREVNGYLAESNISVHLIGEIYGVIPEDELNSIVEIQCEIASQHIGNSEFSQIIWKPQGLNSDDARQQKFISELSNYSNLPGRYTFLQDKLEDLKTLIHERLNLPVMPSVPQKAISGTSDQNSTLIYIVCAQPDYEAVKPIEDYLLLHGFEIISLAGDADAKSHRHYLRQCNAVLVYCGNATDGWLKMKHVELFKLSGCRRANPWLAKAFYLGPPRTLSKERFQVQNGIVIRDFADFSSASLNPFIEQIERARGTRQ